MSPSDDSSLITSAPISARRRVQCGPAIVVVKSTTRSPSRVLVIRYLQPRLIPRLSGLDELLLERQMEGACRYDETPVTTKSLGGLMPAQAPRLPPNLPAIVVGPVVGPVIGRISIGRIRAICRW